MRLLDITIARTTDRRRAEGSRWRWLDDGSGTFRLRLRGLLPLRLFTREEK